jgi:hypothetical protein
MKLNDFKKVMSEALRDQTMTMMGEDDEVEVEGHDVSEDAVVDNLGDTLGVAPDSVGELGEALAHAMMDIIQTNARKTVATYQKRSSVVDLEPNADIAPDKIVDSALQNEDLKEVLVLVVSHATKKKA